jgi:hypothetical protein
MMRATRVALGVAALGAGAATTYAVLLRDRCLTWGATSQEAGAAMPGDDLLEHADVVATRAVSIDAPPSAVWPWLVQMGSGRGGAYTYDWIENLFGLGMHSADRVLPGFQDVRVGDSFALGPGRPPMHVEVLDPERWLVFRFDDGRWIWSFGLRPDRAGTRLVSRNRIATPGASLPARIVQTVVMEPGSLVMERKMLLGIKRRAEMISRQDTVAGAT